MPKSFRAVIGGAKYSGSAGPFGLRLASAWNGTSCVADLKDEMQTAIVTGGNGGLGYQCARVIAGESLQWNVVIASRDHAKSTEAARAITAETGNPGVIATELDLGSLDSVRRFGVDFAARALPPIGAIVCNAAIQVISGLTYNDDGHETTFAVNHLGHFLLVNLLLRRFGDRGRIVVVSSGTHNPDQFTGMPKPEYRDAISVARPEAGTDPQTRDAWRTQRRNCATSCSPTSWRDVSRPRVTTVSA